MNYRIYILGPDKQVRRRVDLQCADDAGAIAAVQTQYMADRPVQLWQGQRFVMPFPGNGLRDRRMRAAG